MTLILGSALLLALFILAFVLFELRHSRETYESIYALIIRDRDAAREEVAALRLILFPQLQRLSQPKGQPPSTTSTATKQTNRWPKWPVNSTRARLKAEIAAHNTRQIGIDRTAQAISDSQPQPAAKEQA